METQGAEEGQEGNFHTLENAFVPRLYINHRKKRGSDKMSYSVSPIMGLRA